ncbi:hypothetical protein Nocox_38100 [Nonomuraea coxensis DSM 45129]|uniref:Secreted protein n=1 Tax=Nonomuraea coxensis DSM 45129 TaxID=1122611 RepID=A0ABX8UCA2_9ACTN|nr:hypothetical protein [Nonomuraea coxensis]QYC45170.1 hypothetical protein Nocox_38100 [Nonomuraea coxensis DSM 45129]
MVTSAVVLVVALLAVLAVLVARSRRTRPAPAGHVEPVQAAPVPQHGFAKPIEDYPWTRQLLEAIENVTALDERDTARPSAPHDPERPGTDSPAHGSGADPEATAPWTPPVEPYIPPGPLESFFNSQRRDPGTDPAAASPPGGPAPAEDDPVRGRPGEHPAGEDDDTTPGSTTP